MGSGLATRLANRGHIVTAYSHSASALHLPKEVRVLSDIELAARNSDFLITAVPDFVALSQVLSLTFPLEGKRVLQIATIAPWQTRKCSEIVSCRGGLLIEAPLFGSWPDAIDGTLAAAVGPKAALDDATERLLSEMLRSWSVFDELGQASAAKLALNHMMLAMTAAFATSLAYIREEGVAYPSFMDVLRSSSLQSQQFEKKFDSITQDDFRTTRFSTIHLRKDARLFLDEIKAHGLNASVVESLVKVLERAVQEGLGALDYASIARILSVEVQSKMSG